MDSKTTLENPIVVSNPESLLENSILALRSISLALLAPPCPLYSFKGTIGIQDIYMSHFCQVPPSMGMVQTG